LSSWGRGMEVLTQSCHNGARRHALCQDLSVTWVRVNGSRLNTSTADLLGGVKYEPFGECRVFRVSMDSHKLQSSGSLASAFSLPGPSSTGRDGLRTVLPSVFEGGESVMDGCARVAAGNGAPGRRCSGLSSVAFLPARTASAWGTDPGRPRSVATGSCSSALGGWAELGGPLFVTQSERRPHDSIIAMQTTSCKAPRGKPSFNLNPKSNSGEECELTLARGQASRRSPQLSSK
jgi:hypothetical protein